MAAVVDTSSSPVSGDQRPSSLAADSLPLIDLRLLSQSELLSLSVCSSSFSSVHNLHNDTDVSTPRIDRSVFNESAGSRKQTFSRLRLARRGSSRRPSASPSTATPLRLRSAEVPLDEESRLIVSGLKSLFGVEDSGSGQSGGVDNLVSVPVGQLEGTLALPSNRTCVVDSGSGQSGGVDNLVSVSVRQHEGTLALPSIRKGVVDSGSGQSGGMDNLVSVPVGQHEGLLALPSNMTGELEIELMNIPSSSRSRDIEQPVVVLAISADPVPSPKKRKRGRPSKTNINLHANPCSMVNNVVSHAENRIVLVPDGVENNRLEENTGIMNVGENAIELAMVATTDDPYGDRLRNNTAGMRTKEEVLDFLQGIQGEWVTSKRKRKIVDASAFGDILPSGWKLLIRVTRRRKNVWLDCARYISPNGQQFVSFKEVGSYLHSASGLQDATLSNFGVVDGNVRVTSQYSAENMFTDDNNGCECPSTWSVSPTRPIEPKEDTYAIEMGSLDELQIEKSYKCHKCRMAFHQQDELLEHLVTSHRRTPKRIRYGTTTNEEAIIKDGKYECQLCPKTFDERHRFNGHFGNHIKDYLKRIQASLGKGTFQKGVVLSPSSVASPLPTSNINAIPTRDDALSEGVKLHGSIRFDMAKRASGAATNEAIIHGVPCATKANDYVANYNCKQDQVSTTCLDEVGRAKERNGIGYTVNSPPSVVAPILPDTNKNNAICGSSNGAETCKGASDDIDSLAGQEIFSQDASFAASSEHNRHETCNAGTPMNQDEPNRSLFSRSLVLDNEKIIGGQNVENGNISSTIVEDSTIKSADPAEEEVPVAAHVFDCRIEADATTNIPEQTVECCLPAPFVSDEKHGVVNSADGILTPTIVGTVEAKGYEEDSCLTQDQITLGLTSSAKSLPGSLETRPPTDVAEKSRNNYITVDRHSGHSLPSDDTVSNEQNGRYGSHLGKPSNDHMFYVVRDIKENPRSSICRLPEEKEADDDCQLALSCSEHFSGLKADVAKVSSGEGETLKCDKAVFSERNYFGFDTALPLGYLGNVEEERSSTSLSHMSSAHRQSYTLECQAGYNMQAHGDVNQVNQISSISVDSRNNDANSSYKGDQSIYYGHACATQNSLTMRNNEQETFPAVIIGQDRCSMDEYPRSNDGSVENFLPFPFNGQVRSFGNDLNRAFPQSEFFGNSRKKGMESCFNGDAQTNRSTATREFMWRTDEESNLLGGFADTPSQPVLSSNSLPPYDLVQRKGGSDLFGFKFGGSVSGSPGLRLGNMDNPGFGFRDSQRTSHSEDPKILSYAKMVNQELDSSPIWAGKEALPLLPKMGTRHDLPIVCISCRKMFHYSAPDSRSGFGTDGFICAVCNAKFPGRLSLQ
ncbi:unnamed protein product [Linum trigynum]|uniref:Methyl-CpG-binding domain-containing protein 8 n=1 Tax=Linum trigynum TaxID=586398 RepID=A0AAV2EWI9_9ROSI